MRELLESFYKAFNDHNPEVVGQHLTEDFTQTTPYGGSISKAQMIQHLHEVYGKVHDKKVEPKQWFIDGDDAAVVIESTGKQVERWMGVDSTEKSFRITAVHLFRARNGLIEHWRPVWNADHLKKMLTS